MPTKEMLVPAQAMPPEIATWVLSYVAEEARPERVDAWVDRVVRRLEASFPELAAPSSRADDLTEEIRGAVREHWLAFLGEFAQSEQHFHLVDAAVRLAEDMAERQIPLETLTRIYRVAQQEVWEYVAEVIAGLGGEIAPGIDRADLLIHFWGRAASWLDDSVGATTETYQAARAKALAGAAAQRFEAAQAVLAGELTDPREASASLGGYPITVHHTALVLSATDAERAGSLEAVGNELARRIGASKPLIVKPGGRQLWLWLGTRDAPDLATLPALSSEISHDSVTVGVGSSTAGIAGFVASHREAQGALQVASPDGDRWLAVYTDVELPVLLGCSPEVDLFVDRTIGPLLGDDEGTQRLRETLEAFLARGGSAEEAAKELVVHRNTVRYRLGQAEELLGRPISRTSPTIWLALQHHTLFHS
ncbi:PucR family transcriptional regulator [Nocardioides caeni]|uniref:PucR family transcriptional regulator n=1 Tax=Nocardioides caeni TaxID=574700 RepID=A0A4S8N330_9ACTN|nr:helix-turn-helix domain-containing protein [Nocardioides caeni]THV09144.1 hypothetical protein E9934_17065 [Nocardioides caeni]